MKPLLKRKFFLTAAVVIGGILLLIALGSLVYILSPAYSLTPVAIKLVQDAVIKQQNIQKDIQAAYQAGKFPFNSPLVIQDPFGKAPLTALIIFDTPDAAQISIHVPGKEPQADVDFTFESFSTHHEVPIYGLYADAKNVVTVSMKLQDGEITQTEIPIQTEPLPVYLSNILVDKLNRDQYSPGFNFTFLDYKTVYDIDGAVRWYSTTPTWQVFTKLKNGRYLYTYIIGDSKSHIMMEQDLLGKIYSVYYISGGVQHDIFEMPSGNFLITTEDLNSKTIEDFVAEIDRNSGHVVHTFDLKKYLDQFRPTTIAENLDDWLHLNSIVYDASDGSIIISSRTQSSVIKMSYPDMQIKWILGVNLGWSDKYQPYMLKPVGDSFEWPWTQHHATLYRPAITGSGQVEILLFDNGADRNFDITNTYSPTQSRSQVMVYRIDQTKMTVEQVWEYGKERGSELFSSTRGSAYVLANGNVLGDFAEITKDAAGNPAVSQSAGSTTQSRVIEVNPTSNEVASEYTIPAMNSYRVFRAGLYDGYSEGNNLVGAPLEDYTSLDLQDRFTLFQQDVQDWWGQMISSVKGVAHGLLNAIGK